MNKELTKQEELELNLLKTSGMMLVDALTEIIYSRIDNGVQLLSFPELELAARTHVTIYRSLKPSSKC